MTDVLSEQVELQDVEEVSPRIQVLHFAVALPPTAMQGFDEPMRRAPVNFGDMGVVGTITLLNKSAMIWFGWGRIVEQRQSDRTARGIPTMGQVVIAMPRTTYKGAFANSHESSSSQLVGGGEEDQMIGGQMACRLSQRLGFPIIVSCCLASEGVQMETLLSGLDRSSVAQRAAALAEREVARLLTEHKVS
jgi:hypothetical protein